MYVQSVTEEVLDTSAEAVDYEEYKGCKSEDAGSKNIKFNTYERHSI